MMNTDRQGGAHRGNPRGIHECTWEARGRPPGRIHASSSPSVDGLGNPQMHSDEEAAGCTPTCNRERKDLCPEVPCSLLAKLKNNRTWRRAMTRGQSSAATKLWSATSATCARTSTCSGHAYLGRRREPAARLITNLSSQTNAENSNSLSLAGAQHVRSPLDRLTTRKGLLDLAIVVGLLGSCCAYMVKALAIPVASTSVGGRLY